MATFTLKKDTDRFQFDTLSGTVMKNDIVFGTWTTDPQNRLLAIPEEGNSVQFPVMWKFNDRNELCLLDDRTQLVNFHDDAHPSYSVEQAILNVKPMAGQTRQFHLRGEWDLDDRLRLYFTTPDNVRSTLDGRLSDVNSRFVYHIASLVPGHENHQSLLLFPGTWRTNPLDHTQLQFLYKRDNLTEDIFSLPGTYAFDTTDNKLLYSYTAAGRTHGITFPGNLRISPDFQLTYSVKAIQGQTGGMITATAAIANRSFDGMLELAVTNPRTGLATYAIAGKFTHVRQSGTRIGAGFSIAGGNGQPLTLVFQGSFSMNGSGTLNFTFARNAQHMTIAFSSSQIKIGDASIHSSATIELTEGRLIGVEAMFGMALG